MRELKTGLWHWAAPHPDWTQSEPWDQTVSSYAIDDGEHLLLFDPILADFGRGLEIPEQWLRAGVTREQVVEGLRPLLALPVEHVLATHGGPMNRSALERALA